MTWTPAHLTILPTSGGGAAGGDLSPQTSAVPWYANSVPVYGIPWVAVDSNVAGVVFGVNTLRYMPFRIGINCTVNQMGFAQTAPGAAGAVGRVGIYDSLNGVPNVRLFDSGSLALDGANGYKNVAANVSLTAGALYWTATVFGVNNPTIHGAATGVSHCMVTGLGVDPNAVAGAGVQCGFAAFAFAALPALASTAPPTATAAGAPITYMRFGP